MQHRMVRKGGCVKRWHTIPNAQEQTVAAHSWGVACIILELWPDSSMDLVRAALLHDVAEQFTGDIPATAKWANPGLAKEANKAEELFWGKINSLNGTFPALKATEQLKLKIADMMELLWYCIEEERLGNRNFKEVFVRGVKYMQDLMLDDPAVHMLNELIAMEAEL
jgi:5'-deoxynucleotidase YfbR-like HD superfamily hydrolase